jgi:hypothetical protein
MTSTTKRNAAHGTRRPVAIRRAGEGPLWGAGPTWGATTLWRVSQPLPEHIALRADGVSKAFRVPHEHLAPYVAEQR